VAGWKTAAPFDAPTCKPPLFQLSVNAAESGVNTTIHYGKGCGTYSDKDQTILTEPFDGTLATDTRGISDHHSIRYWPHNNTLFLELDKPLSWIWMYQSTESLRTSTSAYLVSGPWHLNSSWSSDGTNACCLPKNNHFAVQQKTQNDVARFHIDWDPENGWCLLYSATLITEYIGSVKGGGLIFGDMTTTYFGDNDTLALYFDDCAEYYTEGCTTGFFFNEANDTCILCPAPCATCAEENKCLTCQRGFIMNKAGVCVIDNSTASVTVPIVIGLFVISGIIWCCYYRAINAKDSKEALFTAIQSKGTKELSVPKKEEKKKELLSSSFGEDEHEKFLTISDDIHDKGQNKME
jgi:hypothetical protein